MSELYDYAAATEPRAAEELEELLLGVYFSTPSEYEARLDTQPLDSEWAGANPAYAHSLPTDT